MARKVRSDTAAVSTAMSAASPPKGFVPWNAASFQLLATQPPEALRQAPLTVDPSGVWFKPVVMEEACQTCHSLTFDKIGGTFRTLRHGEPEMVVADLRGFFAGGAPARPINRRWAVSCTYVVHEAAQPIRRSATERASSPRDGTTTGPMTPSAPGATSRSSLAVEAASPSWRISSGCCRRPW